MCKNGSHVNRQEDLEVNPQHPCTKLYETARAFIAITDGQKSVNIESSLETRTLTSALSVLYNQINYSIPKDSE